MKLRGSSRRSVGYGPIAPSEVLRASETALKQNDYWLGRIHRFNLAATRMKLNPHPRID